MNTTNTFHHSAQQRAVEEEEAGLKNLRERLSKLIEWLNEAKARALDSTRRNEKPGENA